MRYRVKSAGVLVVICPREHRVEYEVPEGQEELEIKAACEACASDKRPLAGDPNVLFSPPPDGLEYGAEYADLTFEGPGEARIVCPAGHVSVVYVQAGVQSLPFAHPCSACRAEWTGDQRVVDEAVPRKLRIEGGILDGMTLYLWGYQIPSEDGYDIPVPGTGAGTARYKRDSHDHTRLVPA